MATRDPGERFWSKVDRAETCWLWAGARLPAGYGLFRLGERMVYAHRFAYELLVGPIPDGLTLDHLCRNRSCVNPAHLEPVTHAENIHRSPIAVAAINARKTHCKRGHLYDQANTARKAGHRRCRACNRDRHRRRAVQRQDALSKT